ncbi:MAG: thioesterase family protein [Propionibacteriaceae bacterium]|nr:thioesterase family protein [Propionibacteriaceae bacterium]
MEPYRVRVPLRWVDLDAQGHANNAAIVDYLQEARVEFLLTSPNAHLLGNGIIVVGHQVEYLGPIHFSPEPLDVELSVADVGAARFTVGYVVRQGEQVVGRARTVLANFDFTTGRPARLTDAERAWFAERQVELESLREVGSFTLGPDHHTQPFQVRWSDLDAYGHANNTRFFDYVAEARVALKAPLLANAIRMNPVDEVEHAWMVVRQDMRYTGQIVHRLEPYEVHTAVGATGRTSMTVAAEIVDPLTDAVLARSTTVLVHGDAQGRAQPLPPEILRAAQDWPAEQTGRPLL